MKTYERDKILRMLTEVDNHCWEQARLQHYGMMYKFGASDAVQLIRSSLEQLEMEDDDRKSESRT